MLDITNYIIQFNGKPLDVRTITSESPLWKDLGEKEKRLSKKGRVNEIGRKKSQALSKIKTNQICSFCGNKFTTTGHTEALRKNLIIPPKRTCRGCCKKNVEFSENRMYENRKMRNSRIYLYSPNWVKKQA